MRAEYVHAGGLKNTIPTLNKSGSLPIYTYLHVCFVNNSALSPPPAWEHKSVHPFPSVSFSIHLHPFPLEFFIQTISNVTASMIFFVQGMNRHSLALKCNPTEKRKNKTKWSKPEEPRLDW